MQVGDKVVFRGSLLREYIKNYRYIVNSKAIIKWFKSVHSIKAIRRGLYDREFVADLDCPKYLGITFARKGLWVAYFNDIRPYIKNGSNCECDWPPCVERRPVCK
jgi:hypothetical protein